MNKDERFFRVPSWYPDLAQYTWETKFVKLPPEAIEMIASANFDNCNELLFSQISKNLMSDMSELLSEIPGNAFVFTDSCAPTDTERYFNKGGAVYSARSALANLLHSRKIISAAKCGEIEYICMRPYRNITKAREFRLFINDGKLVAMSQYHLIRHFRRLEGVKDSYWEQAVDFVNEISWRLTVKTLVMDIYITSDRNIFVVDLNPWGEGTDPLMLITWDRDWTQPVGIKLMAPPIALSGDVKVSF